jgi:hypothetical protein
MSSRNYEIHIRGELPIDAIAELRGLTLSVEPPQTTLCGEIRDQAALHGILNRLLGLGVELVDIRCLPEAHPPSKE